MRKPTTEDLYAELVNTTTGKFGEELRETYEPVKHLEVPNKIKEPRAWKEWRSRPDVAKFFRLVRRFDHN